MLTDFHSKPNAKSQQFLPVKETQKKGKIGLEKYLKEPYNKKSQWPSSPSIMIPIIVIQIIKFHQYH